MGPINFVMLENSKYSENFCGWSFTHAGILLQVLDARFFVEEVFFIIFFFIKCSLLLKANFCRCLYS